MTVGHGKSRFTHAGRKQRNLCALGSGLATAWHVVCLRKHAATSPLSILVLANILVAVVGVPWMVAAKPDAVSGGLLLIAGVGAESTRTTLTYAERAAERGVDAVLVVAPHYFGAAMTDEALRGHYLRIADESPVPVVLYNIPKYMHFTLSSALVQELARHENVIGIKDSSGERDLLDVYLKAQSDAFTVITGSGQLWRTALEMGARAGILAVNWGQSEAAMALGLRPGQRMSLIVLPQALRVIVPPMTSEYLSLIKNSSLAVIIGYPDLVSVANTTINQTGQAVEGIAMIMAVYLVISLLISLFMNLYNRAVSLVER